MDHWSFKFRDRRQKIGHINDFLFRVYPANIQEIKYGNNQSIYVCTGVNMEQENTTKDAFGNELHSVEAKETKPETPIKKPHTYLKFRLEVWSGDHLIFQVLEMDERFRSKDGFSTNSLSINDGIEIKSYHFPSISNKDKIYLRGVDSKHDLLPTFLKVDSSTEILKKDVLDVLSQFWKWEGFKDDFKESEIKIQETQSLKNTHGFMQDPKRFIFSRPSQEITNNEEVFLDYQIWERDNLTFLKVNYIDNRLHDVHFFNDGFIDNAQIIKTNTFRDSLIVFGNSVIPEFNANINAVYSEILNLDFNQVNLQVLKFLEKKLKTQKPELIETEPNSNIYELKG